jgi:hypothetical protein
MQRTYSNMEPRGFPFRHLLWHTSGYREPIPTRIIKGPHSVTSYDMQGDVENLLLPGSSLFEVMFLSRRHLMSSVCRTNSLAGLSVNVKILALPFYVWHNKTERIQNRVIQFITKDYKSRDRGFITNIRKNLNTLKEQRTTYDYYTCTYFSGVLILSAFTLGSLCYFKYSAKDHSAYTACNFVLFVLFQDCANKSAHPKSAKIWVG